MAGSATPSLDGSRFKAQFQGLSGRHPGLWPVLPRVLLALGLFAALVAVGYSLYWRDLFDQLEAGRSEEARLKSDYSDKIRQAVNLPVLRKQKEQVDQAVSQLEKQLPSRAEMDALLSDINQAGVGRGAQLQLFKPGQVVVREYYAELPIAVRVSGNFHDLGSFASDVANLPRIVTLNNLAITLSDKTGGLTMDAVAKTFRYLDSEEIAKQRQEAARRKKGPGGKPSGAAPAASGRASPSTPAAKGTP
ncbi:MAG: type 4a pilus biogenesis protein PilO [Burkholderiaceae bacterium]